MSFDEVQTICLDTIVNRADFTCIQLVYGYAGKIRLFILNYVT